MTDTWAATRADIELWKTLRGIDPDSESVRVEQLLADAEALLAVVMAAKEWADMRGRPVYTTETGLIEALAALPEHLR